MREVSDEVRVGRFGSYRRSDGSRSHGWNIVGRGRRCFLFREATGALSYQTLLCGARAWVRCRELHEGQVDPFDSGFERQSLYGQYRKGDAGCRQEGWVQVHDLGKSGPEFGMGAGHGYGPEPEGQPD